LLGTEATPQRLPEGIRDAHLALKDVTAGHDDSNSSRPPRRRSYPGLVDTVLGLMLNKQSRAWYQYQTPCS